MKIKQKYKKYLKEPKVKKVKFKFRHKPVFIMLQKLKYIHYRLNNISNGVLLIIMIFTVFTSLLLANKIRLEHLTVESQEVGKILVDWNKREATINSFNLSLIVMLFFQYTWNNFIPRKTQVFQYESPGGFMR